MTYVLYIFASILFVQLLCFLVAYRFRTDKLTDLAYGATFAVLVAYLYLFQSEQTILQMIVSSAVIVRGVRLAGYLFIRILHKGKDMRFDEMREQFRLFLGFWVLQAVTIRVVLLPTLIVLEKIGGTMNYTLTVVGGIVWFLGFIIETVADRQKFQFKKIHPDKFTNVGLWSLARHPNYFGEILVWIGVFVMCSQILAGRDWLSIISPIFIFVLLRWVSGVPLLEKQRDEKYGDDPAWQTYKQKTRLFVPLVK